MSSFLVAKFNELEAYVLELDKIKFNFTMICLQESWLKDNDDVSQIQLENYYCITQGRHCSAKGGLLTYVHQTQHFTLINNEHEYNSCEYQIVKLTNDGETKDIMVIKIYIYIGHQMASNKTTDNLLMNFLFYYLHSKSVTLK